ncbi:MULTISPECIES: hypothetical protein [unclassified Mesorhizobium]|jgi:hypothetical protein|uniref:hypothetical protein n=1 Tax=unclassified Mesorhizobium TaxID=325217 RepID=UPI000FCB2B44|nr:MULTISPECIES: hypothetical protein [unclassified Mesorhizobium]RUX93553.1 hypothetical protein EN993_19060 [Mesorhizobium sp. M7D.F.Ca.US.004.01.2.1]RVA29877.1 hypothetical protein EN935_16045 [Mesorhizobium sp. M7D.F.Ca.US.004.03.1.1]
MTRPFQLLRVVALAAVGGALVQLGSDAGEAAAATPAAKSYGYDVKISFSPEAIERMKSLHRQVTLANQFYGDASPEAIARLKLKPYAQLEMGAETIPVDVVDQTVHVTGAPVIAKKLADIVDQKPSVLVQIFSGSNTPGANDNQLHCDLFQDQITLAQSQAVDLHCEAIPEDLVGKE